MTRLKVNEIFGPTVQGEGRSAGMPCAFLRLAGCNLACSWCDTRYAWDWSAHDPAVEVHPMGTDEVLVTLEATGVRALVVTGGEPMLQQAALVPLLARLRAGGWWVEVETAGTVAPADPGLADQYNVSPKLSNSGNPEEKRIVPAALEALRDTGRAVWKFVVTSGADLDEVDALVARYGLDPVYVMPEGVEAGVLAGRAAALVDAAVARGYWLSPRLHVMLWGNRRGV